MDKAEILQRLKVTRQLQTMDDTPEWRAAFILYNKETGFNFKAQDRCHKCFNKVSAWIQDIKE